jgi:hypothetical protein
MSSRTIELFRELTEKHQHKDDEPKSKRQAQEQSEQSDTPSLVGKMSRLEHEVREAFDNASPGERDNIIRFLERLVRNLKRQAANE